jgi:type IV pilus assembly protein PilA
MAEAEIVGSPKRPVRWPLVVSFFAGAATVLAVFLVVFVLVPMVQERRRWAEVPYVASLRALNIALVEYEVTYGNGYPPSLSVMAIPPEGAEPGCLAAGLLDPALAMGQKHGYVYIYTPGPPIVNAPLGCVPGARSFSIVARPLKFGVTGKRNYFVDESGVMRYTTENRAATASDPPLQ